MKIQHGCHPEIRPLPPNATWAQWTWKCPECKQMWHVRQGRDGNMDARRIGRNRWMKVPA